MLKKEHANGGIKAASPEGGHGPASATSILDDLTPPNVSYFKEYASYMSKNNVNTLEASELVDKVGSFFLCYVVSGVQGVITPFQPM